MKLFSVNVATWQITRIGALRLVRRELPQAKKVSGKQASLRLNELVLPLVYSALMRPSVNEQFFQSGALGLAQASSIN